jgi:valyl-tRNA synthetase
MRTGRNFANKIWNALRLVKGWHSSGGILNQSGEELAISWMESRFQEVLKETHQQMEDFRLSESLKNIYSFVWEDFCGFYLEALSQKMDKMFLIIVMKRPYLFLSKFAFCYTPTCLLLQKKFGIY